MQLYGALAHLLRSQGIAVLVNKFFGPQVNAAMSVANSVNGHANTLSSAMTGALLPAITTACGAGDRVLMRKMAFRACKLGAVLSLLFLLPLSLELEHVIKLWLREPPAYTVGLCLAMMVGLLADTISIGQMSAVLANGKIRDFQLVAGSVMFMTFFLAWLLVANGWGVYAIGFSYAFIAILHAGARAFFARLLVGMGLRHWVFRVVFPVGVATAAAGTVGALPHLFMAPSIWRVGVTTLVAEAVFLPLLWGVVFDAEERAFVLTRVRARLPGRFRKPGK